VHSRVPFIFIGIAALVIAIATVLPDGKVVYGSLWFKLLWGVIVICGCIVMWKRKLWRRPTVFSLHVSFIVILLGALVTSVTSRRGILHLRQGIPTEYFLNHEEKTMDRLPCMVRLDTFWIAHYPGTEAPQDYICKITAEGKQYTISMNKIGRLHGYRLYQTNYDEDLMGTLLSVNYDPWGTGITYAGYLLFLLSFLASLWMPVIKQKKTIPILLLLLCSTAANAHDLPVVSREKADSIEREQIIWNDRPCPIGTMAQDFLQKIYGSKSYRGLSATQVITSWTLAPKAWNKMPLIKQKGKGYRKMDDFIDYSSPTPKLKNVGEDPATDEKVALILMLQQGTLIQSIPTGMERLSETRVSIELLYNRIPWTILGILGCMLAVCIGLLNRRGANIVIRTAVILFLLTHFVIRWYLGHHIPLANTYETLHFIALCLVPIMPLSSAATLLVAWLVERNPQITPLMPVLHSPWLSAHVTVVMLSYALLIASFFRRYLLRYAVSLLGIGIFLGAVWANVSWGAYWTWDPKESWALITLLVYSIPLHTQSLPWFKSDRNYRIYSLLALTSLLMTYFGVNYLLGGMHAYG